MLHFVIIFKFESKFKEIEEYTIHDISQVRDEWATYVAKLITGHNHKVIYNFLNQFDLYSNYLCLLKYYILFAELKLEEQKLLLLVCFLEWQGLNQGILVFLLCGLFFCYVGILDVYLFFVLYEVFLF